MKTDIHERLNRAVDYGILSKHETVYTSRINFSKTVPQNVKSMLQGPIEFDYIS